MKDGVVKQIHKRIRAKRLLEATFRFWLDWKYA